MNIDAKCVAITASTHIIVGFFKQVALDRGKKKDQYEMDELIPEEKENIVGRVIFFYALCAVINLQ